MAYRKIYLAIDCQSEEEVAQVQNFAKEISGLFQLQARDIIKISPSVRKNSSLIVRAIKTISTEGAVGVAKMIPYFLSNIKK